MKDPIDTAIDLVAARMVQVREDEDLAMRIAIALPERSSRFSWLIPQFAAIAAFAIAAVVWTMRDPATPSLLLSSNVVTVMAFANPVAAREPITAFRTPPLEFAFAHAGERRRDKRLEPLEPMEPWDGPDFERSLVAIAAPDALVLRSLAPPSLPQDAPLTLEPLVIADLPLTAETISPR